MVPLHKTQSIPMDPKRDFTVFQRPEDNRTTFSDLPEDCVRIILAKMPSHKDILRLGRTNSYNHDITNEMLIWKQLSFFHFTNRQLVTFLPLDKEELQIDWKDIYRRCVL